LLAILAFSAAIILTIGITAAKIYISPDPYGARDIISQHFYDKNYNLLDSSQKADVDWFIGLPSSSQERNSLFNEWLFDFNQWLIK